MDRLEKLIDLFESSENVYILNELKLLKTEINTLVLDTQIETLKNLKKELISKI
jgi:hypothetical protein